MTSELRPVFAIIFVYRIACLSEIVIVLRKETVENILAFNENVLVDEIKKIVFILDF